MKRLEKFTHTRISRLKKLLKKYSSLPDSETLHSIRVEIKKIKASLQAIGSSDKKFKSHKKFLSFRDIFRKAGAIREQELVSQLLLKYDIPGASPEFLPEKQEAEERFKEDLPVFLRHIDDLKNTVFKAVRKTSKKDFLKYLDKTKKQVKRGLYPGVNTGTLHKTRKNAKTFLYLSPVAGSTGKKYRKFLEAFENIAGNWHDKQSLLALHSLGEADKETLRSASKQDENGIERLARKFYEK